MLPGQQAGRAARLGSYGAQHGCCWRPERPVELLLVVQTGVRFVCLGRDIGSNAAAVLGSVCLRVQGSRRLLY